MAEISTTDARPLFTKELAARFSDRRKPDSFFRSMFKETEHASKLISIEVERDNDTIAVDVLRGTEGNRNSFDRTSEKIFCPPMYDEYFDATELDVYDALYTQDKIAAVAFGRFVQTVGDKLEKLYDKIDRAYELQCSQVLHSGIVQLNAGINIDFKRKAASMEDGVANGTGYWTTNGIDPNVMLLRGCTFLKETGKIAGANVNVAMGENVVMALLNNSEVKERGITNNLAALDAILPVTRNAVGASYHGRISVGSYIVNLWSYPETYKDKDGNRQKYMDPNYIIMVPEQTAFTLSYAAVPQLLSTGIAPKKGKFFNYDFIDKRNAVHDFGVKSAGVAIPAAVDQIYTAKVTNG